MQSEDQNFLGYNTVLFGNLLATFRSSLLSLSSG